MSSWKPIAYTRQISPKLSCVVSRIHSSRKWRWRIDGAYGVVDDCGDGQFETALAAQDACLLYAQQKLGVAL